jgi:hypothetical protein
MLSVEDSRTLVVILNWNSKGMTAQCIREVCSAGRVKCEILVDD